MATKILQIVGNLGNEVYTQNDEPIDAKDGALWVDLDEDPIITDIEAALAEAKASGEFNGEDGRSVTSLSINENGELVTIFSDAEEVNLGTVVGADGKSAYDIAAANGYEGTESEFGVALTEVVNSDGLTEEQASDLAANTEARHEHDNKATLDAFGYNEFTDHVTFKGSSLANKDDIPSPIDSTAINNYFVHQTPIPNGHVDASSVTELIDEVNGRFAKTSDIPFKTSELENDSGFITETKCDEKTSALKAEIVDGISLGIASDGLIYIFVDGNPVGTGIPQGSSGDLFGYVDENNTVVLTGNLADGSYNIKYEMEDGSTVDIGDLVLDSNVYYFITNTLTNCTNSNSAVQAVEGESYSATITAKSGYELKTVTVTMGGSPVTVSGGNINIANVTGDIVITAVAEEKVVEIVNQIPLSTDASGNLFNGGQGWKTGYRLSSSSGSESVNTGTEITGFIPVKYTDTVYLKNIVVTTASTETLVFYDANYSRITGTNTQLVFGATNGEVVSKTISSYVNDALASAKDTLAYIRLTASEITNDSIITVNQAIE